MHFSQASSRSFTVLGASRYRYGIHTSVTRVKPFICTMPMSLDDGWNQVQFNLSDFTRRAYGTNYIETLRVQVHANCRIRRIYFCDRLYSEDEVPSDFKLFMPIQDTRYLEGAAYGNAQSAAYAKAHAKGKKKSDKETAE